MSKHLSLDDRTEILTGLKEQKSLSQIAAGLGKSCSTVSREIRKHAVPVDKGAPCRVTNRCVRRRDCQYTQLCLGRPDCMKKCSACKKCNEICPDFLEETCARLSAPPYVCDGCPDQHTCVLRKRYYRPGTAEKQYQELLSQSRQGYNITPLELKDIDRKISPLLKNGHSVHHAFVACENDLTVSESTVSRLVKDRQLTATVPDQQRAVKLKPRKKQRPQKKIDRQCRVGRTFADYSQFMSGHPGFSAVEMDSVIGAIGGKFLLTMIFPQPELMPAFLCDCHTAACVQSKINFLYENPGGLFTSLFPVLLTDNGTEFSNPAAIETAPDGSIRTRVFYCDPMASWQKPHVERNHEFIRMVLPKGTSFDHLKQEDIGLMMSHINSYARPSLGNRSPFQAFAFLYGQETMDRLLRLVCQTEISPEKIVLKPSLLK